MTFGAVCTRSMSASCSSRCWMISMCNRPEKAAAEAEAQGVARLRLELEAGVVDRELVERVAQLLEVLAVGRDTARNTPSASAACSRAAAARPCRPAR